MINEGLILACIVSLTLSVLPVTAEEIMTDPHKIIDKHYDAVGGLDNLKAHTTIYKEGTLNIEGASLKGTFKQWTAKPLKLRQEIDLGVVKSISGDNGEVSWNVDANGKIQLQKDDATIKEREVKKHIEEYELLKPRSPYFTLTFQGIEKVDNEDCYAVKITNTINDNVQTNYYRMSDFYLVQAILVKPNATERTSYSDFRKVDGIIEPFREMVEVQPTGEKYVFEYATYAYNTQIEPSLFEPPQEDVADFRFTDGMSAENVPFRFIENHIYLPVFLSGKEGLWILDCGASVNVIDSSYAAELGLAFEGPIKAQGAHGIVDVYYVTLPPYSLKGIEFKGQKVLSMNVRDLMRKAMGLDVVGILGYDFLSRFTTKIDFAHERLSFYEPQSFKYTGAGKIVDSPLSKDRMLSLPVTVDGKYSGKWTLDIGATGNDFHYAYAKENGLLNLPGIDIMAAGAGAEFIVRSSEFKTMALDEYVVKDPILDVSQEDSRGCFSDKSYTGNIGNTFLRHFVLYLDYRNQRVILEKGDDYAREFPRPKSGLQFWYNDNQDVEVVFVSPNTPAAEAGFKKGDIITVINNINVKHLGGVLALREMMREKAGTTYAVEVVRDEKPVKLNLTLRELY